MFENIFKTVLNKVDLSPSGTIGKIKGVYLNYKETKNQDTDASGLAETASLVNGDESVVEEKPITSVKFRIVQEENGVETRELYVYAITSYKAGNATKYTGSYGGFSKLFQIASYLEKVNQNAIKFHEYTDEDGVTSSMIAEYLTSGKCDEDPVKFGNMVAKFFCSYFNNGAKATVDGVITTFPIYNSVQSKGTDSYTFIMGINYGNAKYHSGVAGWQYASPVAIYKENIKFTMEQGVLYEPKVDNSAPANPIADAIPQAKSPWE